MSFLVFHCRFMNWSVLGIFYNYACHVFNSFHLLKKEFKFPFRHINPFLRSVPAFHSVVAQREKRKYQKKKSKFSFLLATLQKYNVKS